MINFLDFKLQYKLIKNEIDKSFQRVLGKGIFVGGEEVKKFEKEFASFCKVKYAISVNSGTDALFLSLKALGIGQGDEVITTPFTFIATAEAIANCGAKPVFVDIEPNTFNIDVSKIKEAITQNTKAIIPVHLFGQMADMAEIMKIAKKHNLYVIEDSAQSVGAEYNGKKSGVIGNIGCFSFFPSKNLGAMGDGGMVITNDIKLADKVRLLKNHGSSFDNKYKNLLIGTNSRLDEIQAGILRIKLSYLNRWNAERIGVANYYSKNLKGIKEIICPVVDLDKSYVFHQYTLRVERRDKLKDFLFNKGISTMIYYPLPLHLQPALKYLGYKKGDFPEAEKAVKKVISLPIYPELSKKNQDFIIKKIKDFYIKK